MSRSLSNQVTLFGKTVDLPSIFAFIGSAGSGKSYLLQYIVQTICLKNIFKFGWCFTRTNFSGQYNYMGENVTQGYSEKILRNYLSILANMRIRLKMNMPPNFIIFDDLIGSLINSQNNHTFMRLITTFRHYNCSIFIAAQYARGLINPTLREQIRYVYCTNSGDENTTNLYKSFGNRFFKDKKQMAHILSTMNGTPDENADEDEHYQDRSHKFLMMDNSKVGLVGCKIVEAPTFRPIRLVA